MQISRGFLEFLKNDENGMARAFLFDTLLKSLILIVDEVLGESEKSSNDRVKKAVSIIYVRYYFFIKLIE